MLYGDIGVTLILTDKFKIAYFRITETLKRKAAHIQAILTACHRTALLMRCKEGRNHDHFIERKRLFCRFHIFNMFVMNRVE